MKQSQCLALSSLLRNKTSFPTNPSFISSLVSYFSLQESTIHPQCIVSPETASDVSLAVETLTSLYVDLKDDAKKECQFAIRSGGHTAWAGSANIEGAKATVSLGASGSWNLVYSKLDAMNLSVNGGRTAGVGIAGLNTIVNLELVLADGAIINANGNENPDLLWALRGGSNNFGIVTRIDMQTFEQGPIYATYDEFAHLTLTWGFSAAAGLVVVNQLEYSKPIQEPPIFANIRSLPVLFGTDGISNVTQLSKDLRDQAGSGQRIFWNMLTFVSTEAAINITFFRFNESIPSIAGVSGIVSSLTLEPLPPALYARHQASNALGFDHREHMYQSLVVTLLSVSYTSANDDQIVETYGRSLMDAITQDLKKLNAFDPYLYLNYAAPYQDPRSSYTEANVRRLRQIAAKWDPHGIFQYQAPGGFKLFTH
ncbi:putative oxidoreductase [Lophiotrema nucula]|uniref:Putative oxidoreductase n=1 Tax=Lophiotrema nucula TaxID=690887 RepID=A0A6A5ZQ41_9PLEO|nr:putative oxidoreductase [Lophiotrema nucula]